MNTNVREVIESMKKEEVADIAVHLWEHVDQAPFDYDIEELMRSAPIRALKNFIESLLPNVDKEGTADEDIVLKARRLIGDVSK
jgi:hypothetical protein